MRRRQKIIQHINFFGKGLEIGASFNPVFPKSKGYNVKILDHASKEELCNKYAGHKGFDISLIEDVDYVWSGEPYTDLVNSERFDWILGSHVIEHAPDLIAFINDCASILDENGILALVVPDRRYSFDYYRPVSSLSSVIDAHIFHKKKPSTGTLVEYQLTNSYIEDNADNFYYNIRSLPIRNWAENFFYNETLCKNDYMDAHCWVFTPSHMRMLIEDLYHLGLIQVRERAYYPTQGNEFFIFLSQDGSGPGCERLELARKALRENRVFTLAAGRSTVWYRPILGKIDRRFFHGIIKKFLKRIEKQH